MGVVGAVELAVEPGESGDMSPGVAVLAAVLVVLLRGGRVFAVLLAVVDVPVPAVSVVPVPRCFSIKVRSIFKTR